MSFPLFIGMILWDGYPIILLGVTLYLTYGWNLKTHAAVISMILVLLITGTLAAVFVAFMKLTGSGDENALFLFWLAFDVKEVVLCHL
jgi:uncharacterized membrane protein